MKSRVVESLRGALLLIPLVVIAVALLLMARPYDRYEEVVASEELVADADSLVVAGDSPAMQPRFKPFDPNEADYRTLLEAGLPRNIAVGLIKWRTAGKVFSIKEDVALCYGMSDSLYFAIEPYIIIGEAYRIKPKRSDNAPQQRARRDTVAINLVPFSLDSVTPPFLRSIGFTRREAELVVRYRDMIGGYRSLEEFAECYAVGEERAKMLQPYIIFPPRDSLGREPKSVVEFPIEINSADSATLRRVYGIGERSVGHILRYRELLGGYYAVEQISELKVVTEENFRHISQQIWCDSAKIKKININFASPKALMVHPYLSNRMLRRIINHRELKGGWSTIEEMIDSKIFTEEEAMRIAPYLDFGTSPE